MKLNPLVKTTSLQGFNLILSVFDICSFTVLVKEGERCEVIGFIKKGECLLRRHINVAHTFPNGKKVSSPHLSAVHLLNKWGRKM